MPAAELRLLYADSIANNASVWFGITQFEFDQPEMQPLAEMNRYLAGAGEYYRGTRSEANAAVVLVRHHGQLLRGVRGAVDRHG